MWGSVWGFGYYDDEGRVDRAGWSAKSAAASRRERQAKQLLDGFLDQCSKLNPSTDFPRTCDNLVTADIHLTQPCWLSFRKYALSRGCQVKRREATVAERRATGDKRKGKMYVISATLPVHPSRAVQAAENRKVQAAAASAKRKEREEKKAEVRAREEQIKRQRIADAYHRVVADLAARQHSPLQQSSSKAAAALPAVTVASSSEVALAPAAAAAAAVASSTSASASNNSTPSSSSPLVVDPQSILNHAEEVCNARLKEIRFSIYQEKQKVESELDRKKKALEKEALALCRQVKQSVLASSMPTTKQCSLCQKKCKFLVAECVRECNTRICAACLENKVNNEHRCYLCKESWLGDDNAKAPSVKDDSLIQQGNSGLAKFVCQACLAAHPYDNLEYAYCCEEYVCSDHRLDHDCCVCSGGRALCTRCGIDRCHRCGKELCGACSFKEGCMCSEKSGRRLLMEELGEY